MRKGMRLTARNRTMNVRKTMTLYDMFKRFMIDKRAEGLADSTIEGYEITFGYLMDYLGGDLANEEITTDVFLEYKDYMLNDRCFAKGTVNVRVRPIRHFMRYCYEAKDWIYEPIHEEFTPVKDDERFPVAFLPEEVELLLEQVNEDRYIGFRDKVMSLSLLDTMVRISELVKIRRSNMDLRRRQIKLEAHETKGKRERIVPISDELADELAQYIEETSVFGAERLFLTYDGREINHNTFRKQLVQYKESAGLKKQVSPHIFRHTGAVFYILNGGDPYSLQDILGHTSQDMVKRYVRMANVQLKTQHRSFSPLKNISMNKKRKGKQKRNRPLSY